MTDRILPLDIDYTARDFDAYKDRGQRGLESVFEKWSDFSQASFANILHEMVCYVGDVTSVYLDAQAREAHLSTCVRRVNGIRHGRRLGYEFTQAEAATVDLQFTLAQTYAGDVTFAARKVVRSNVATDPARVQLLTDLTITSGNLVGTVTAENSLTYDESFESDDTADQEFELSYTPFLDVVEITDGSGAYTVVANFLDSESTDRDVVVLVSEDGRALLRFGDGVNGKVPVGQVDVTYKTGGGDIVIDPDSLQVPEFTATDSLGSSVTFSVTNPLASVGGRPAETLDEARINAPASIRATQRTVAREDYELRALEVSGVARALMLTSDQYAALAENYGQLYVVARGSQLSSGLYQPATPTAGQLASVLTRVTDTYPKTITFRLDVVAAILKTVNIEVPVYLEAGANAATVDAAIRANLADYFAVSDSNYNPTATVDFGYNYRDELGEPEPLLPWGDLFTIIKTTTGVARVDEDALIPTDDVALEVREFPVLGTITTINARTGLSLV